MTPKNVLSDSSGFGSGLEPRVTATPRVDVGVRSGSVRVEFEKPGGTRYSVTPGARKPWLQLPRTRSHFAGVQDTPNFGTDFVNGPTSSRRPAICSSSRLSNGKAFFLP